MSSLEPSTSSSSSSASNSTPSQFTPDLKMYLELCAYIELLKVQVYLSRASIPMLSLYFNQLRKVNALLQNNSLYRHFPQMIPQELVDLLQENWATPQELENLLQQYRMTPQDLGDLLKLTKYRLHSEANIASIAQSFDEEMQLQRIQLGITLRVFQETENQTTQPMLKTILAALKKNHPCPEQHGRPVELFDFKWLVTTIKDNSITNDIINHIESEERSPYYVKQTHAMTPPINRRLSGLLKPIENGSDVTHISQFLEEIGLPFEINPNTTSNYQHDNKLVNGIQIQFCANPLSLFIALRLHYIARGLENPENFVDLNTSMKDCFKSFKESRSSFFATSKTSAQNPLETPKTGFSYSS